MSKLIIITISIFSFLFSGSIEGTVTYVESKAGKELKGMDADPICGMAHSIPPKDENWMLNESKIPGKILSKGDRTRWGISSDKFGDIILLLDDGKMFIPNFIGDLGCKAMHGYLPTHITQQGIIASTKKITDEDKTIVAEDVYSKLELFIE